MVEARALLTGIAVFSLLMLIFEPLLFRKPAIEEALPGEDLRLANQDLAAWCAVK